MKSEWPHDVECQGFQPFLRWESYLLNRHHFHLGDEHKAQMTYPGGQRVNGPRPIHPQLFHPKAIFEDTVHGNLSSTSCLLEWFVRFCTACIMEILNLARVADCR